MITIRNLHKSYGKNPVLQGLNLDLHQPGKVIAILGPNGSGKTTLIKSILGMVLPDSGSIEVNGKNIKGEWSYRAQIDYLPQIARFPENLTVRELIDFIKDLRGETSNDGRFIQLFGLEPHLDKRLSNLSGGTKQKVNLTLAMLYDSPIVIMDEPTSGLDPVAMLHFRELIREERAKGKIVLITTHIMSLVEEIADEVVFLLEGKIYFQGTIKELLHQHNESSVERAIAQILSGTLHYKMNGNVKKTAIPALILK
jgi:Cu-processing system ATP-binding protein